MKTSIQDERYVGVAAEFDRAFERLARGYEADANLRSDPLQEIHLARWRSLAGFDGRWSMRTWVYRVAHNAASSYVTRRCRTRRLGARKRAGSGPPPSLLRPAPYTGATPAVAGRSKKRASLMPSVLSHSTR